MTRVYFAMASSVWVAWRAADGSSMRLRATSGISSWAKAGKARRQQKRMLAATRMQVVGDSNVAAGVTRSGHCPLRSPAACLLGTKSSLTRRHEEREGESVGRSEGDDQPPRH